jgi:hypothetical protein
MVINLMTRPAVANDRIVSEMPVLAISLVCRHFDQRRHGEISGQSANEHVVTDAMEPTRRRSPAQVLCAVSNGTLGSGLRHRFEVFTDPDPICAMAALCPGF